MINCILGHVTASPAFDEGRLFEEFKATLVANKLLDRSEIRLFESLKTIIGLYAISQMHLCNIDLGDGTHAELSAGATLSGGTIKVNATAELLDAKRIFVATTFFESAIDVKTYCEPELHPSSDQQPIWPYPIELTNNGKLGRMA